MKISTATKILLASLFFSTQGFAYIVYPYDPYQAYYQQNDYYGNSSYYGGTGYSNQGFVDAYGRPINVQPVDAFGKPLQPVPVDAFGKPLKVVTPPTYDEHAKNTPSITYQNDTDATMTGGYTAVIMNKNHQTRTLQDTFPIPPGTITTPQLPFYLINQRVFITEQFDDCSSTVVFNVEQRGGVFSIIEGSAMGSGCPTSNGPTALFGTVLQDGFTILLLERPAGHSPRH